MKITKKCVMAIAACVLLILQAFGLRPDVPVVNEIVSAVSSVLVMLGILSDSSGGGSVSGSGGADAGDDENSGAGDAESGEDAFRRRQRHGGRLALRRGRMTTFARSARRMRT